MAKKILITGAGGFIGGFIVEEALRRGYETWAAVRKTTNREFLQDSRIHFIELDFTDGQALKAALQQAIAESGGKWHYVVHNLGATKAANYIDFERINYGYMRLLVEPLKASLCRVYAIVERPTVAEAAHGSKPLGIALQLLRVRLIVDKQTLHHRVLVRINGFQPVDDVGRLHVQLHSKVNHGARTVAFRSCGS